MTPLDLATFEEIGEELKTRFANVAVIVNAPLVVEPGDQQRFYYEGNPNVLLGLLMTLQYDVLRSKEETTKEGDEV